MNKLSGWIVATIICGVIAAFCFGMVALTREVILAPYFVRDVLCVDNQLQVLVENEDYTRSILNTGYTCRK
jgi:hypothetical protein